MFPLVCQICKELTHRGSMCRKCFISQYRIKQVKEWNEWIKETRKKKNANKIKFNNKDDIQFVRTLEEEISLNINSEVMDVLQDMIFCIVETKKIKKKRNNLKLT